MNRRLLRSLLPNQELSLAEVWGWYEFQHALIGEERSRVFDAISRGQMLGPQRYFNKARDELDQDFSFQTDELSHCAMLGMMSATEAALRVDFILRIAHKGKDAFSKQCWKTYRWRRWRRIDSIRLEEDILDGWRLCGNSAIAGAVGPFKGALNLRHWLAHGRYWTLKAGQHAGYDPVDIFDICKELLQATGLMPADL